MINCSKLFFKIHEADLTDVSKFDSLVKEIVSDHGQLDFLFNNAGTLAAGKIGEITEESFEELTNIHLKAPMFLTQAAMPYLKATRGCIVWFGIEPYALIQN